VALKITSDALRGNLNTFLHGTRRLSEISARAAQDATDKMSASSGCLIQDGFLPHHATNSALKWDRFFIRQKGRPRNSRTANKHQVSSRIHAKAEFVVGPGSNLVTWCGTR
jgi:hypothetical protein